MKPSRSEWALGVALSLWMVLAAGEAQGALIRYDFAGSIDEAAEGTGVAPGTRFSGSFTVDDSAPTTYVRLPDGMSDSVRYTYGTHQHGGVADGTGFSFHLEDGRFVVNSDGLTIDGYTFYSNQGGIGSAPISLRGDEPGEVGGPGADYGLGLYLRGGARLLPDSGGPFPRTLTLDDLNEATFVLMGRIARTPSVEWGMPIEDVFPDVLVGRLDLLTATPVPEPTWAVAVLLGTTVWVIRRRGSA